MMTSTDLSCTARSSSTGIDALPIGKNKDSSTPQSAGSRDDGYGEKENKKKDNDSTWPIKVSGMTLVLTFVVGLAAASVVEYRRKVQQQQQNSRGDFSNIPQEDESVVGITMTDPHHDNEHSQNNYTGNVELGELS